MLGSPTLRLACLMALMVTGCGGQVESWPACSESTPFEGAAELDPKGLVLGKAAFEGTWLLQVRSKGTSEWSAPIPIQWEIHLVYLIARSADGDIELVYPIVDHVELGRDWNNQACVLPYAVCVFTPEPVYECEGWWERTGIKVDWSTPLHASEHMTDLLSLEENELSPVEREDPELVVTTPNRLSQINVTASYSMNQDSHIEDIEVMLRRELQ